MSAPIFTIPAGTPVDACRSCRQPVYWITTSAGRPMPVTVRGDAPAGELQLEVHQDRDPTPERAGIGISHFATCPHADSWRRR